MIMIMTILHSSAQLELHVFSFHVCEAQKPEYLINLHLGFGAYAQI